MCPFPHTQCNKDVRVQTSELLIKAGKYPLYSEHLGDTSPTEQTYITDRMAG